MARSRVPAGTARASAGRRRRRRLLGRPAVLAAKHSLHPATRPACSLELTRPLAASLPLHTQLLHLSRLVPPLSCCSAAVWYLRARSQGTAAAVARPALLVAAEGDSPLQPWRRRCQPPGRPAITPEAWEGAAAAGGVDAAAARERRPASPQKLSLSSRFLSASPPTSPSGPRDTSSSTAARMDRRIAARLLLALAAAASVLPSAHALSWPLCNDGGQARRVGRACRLVQGCCFLAASAAAAWPPPGGAAAAYCASRRSQPALETCSQPAL